MFRTPENNFNLLRLLAAWLILFGHSYVLYDRSRDPFIWIHLPGATFYALACFFTISGYLVTSSWVRQPVLHLYALNRLLRIVPALAVVILLTTFVMGPWVTTLPTAEYFAHGDTWKYLRGMFVFDLRYSLPGTFEQLPYPNMVNGSLWSLKLEVQLYMMLAALACIGLLKPRFILCLAVLFLLGDMALHAMQSPPRYILGLKYGNLNNLSRWGFFFWAGSAFYLYRDRIRFTRRLTAIVVLAACIGYASLGKHDGYYALAACTPYLILALALQAPPAVPALLKRNDLSYGIYLYACPIQQVYMYYVGTSYGIGMFIMVCTLLSLCAAWLSWHCVETPALRLKPSMKFRREPVAVPSP